MMRKLTYVLVAILLSGAALAATASAILPGFTIVDFIEAWPATKRTTHTPFARVVTYPATVYGRATAHGDIAAGRLGVKMWGLPARSRTVYAELLQARGIEATTVAGCVVSYPQLGLWEGYNDVMNAEIERRYGKTFFQETSDAADEEFARRQSANASLRP